MSVRFEHAIADLNIAARDDTQSIYRTVVGVEMINGTQSRGCTCEVDVAGGIALGRDGAHRAPSHRCTANGKHTGSRNRDAGLGVAIED